MCAEGSGNPLYLPFAPPYKGVEGKEISFAGSSSMTIVTALL